MANSRQRGKLHGLNDAKLMAQKTAAEKWFKGCVMADKKRAELWDQIASVVQERNHGSPGEDLRRPSRRQGTHRKIKAERG